MIDHASFKGGCGQQITCGFLEVRIALSPEEARRHSHRAAGKGGFSGALRFVT